MAYDKRLVAGKLRRWEGYLDEFHLPFWEDIPDIGLYMEQVTALMKQYLDYLPPELKGNDIVTAATINNYVRMHVMPEPVKKRYYRIHLAYLTMICSLKQGLSIGMIQRLIPADLEPEEFRAIYDSYVTRYKRASELFMVEVRELASPILDHEKISSELATPMTEELIATMAVFGGFCRVFAEKLMVLDDRTLEDGDSIEIVKKSRRRLEREEALLGRSREE